MALPAYIDEETGAITDGEAWVAVGTTTIAGSPATPVTFTSPDDGSSTDWSQFMDLFLLAYIRSQDSGDPYTYLSLNGSTSFPSENQYLQGDGGSTSAGGYAPAGKAWIWRHPYSTETANVFGVGICHFPDINSSKYKTMISQSASDLDGSGYCAMYSNVIRTQAPISSISVHDGAGTGWTIGSRFDLFGILPRMVS